MGAIEMKNSNKLARWVLITGGVILLIQTLFGLLAILGLGFDSVREITTALCLTLAFPIYLLGFKSLRVAIVFLWLFFFAQWINECLISQPRTIRSPFDWPHGDTLFAAIVLAHIGYHSLLKALEKRQPVRLSDAFKRG